MASPFSSAEVMRHRDGIHAPRILVDNGVLTMMGRKIPVISREQLEGRLRQIGCKEEYVAEILGGIFGIAVPVEVLSFGHTQDLRAERYELGVEAGSGND